MKVSLITKYDAAYEAIYCIVNYTLNIISTTYLIVRGLQSTRLVRFMTKTYL